MRFVVDEVVVQVGTLSLIALTRAYRYTDLSQKILWLNLSLLVHQVRPWKQLLLLAHLRRLKLIILLGIELHLFLLTSIRLIRTQATT